MSSLGPDAARGELRELPLAHLLVRTLDRAYTGGLRLEAPDGAVHELRLVRGRITKVRPSDRYALLGSILVERGAVDEQVLEQALSMGGPIGDILLLTGAVAPDALEDAAVEQLRRRAKRLFELPGEARFELGGDADPLEHWGVDCQALDPLAILAEGLRACPPSEDELERVLGPLAELELRLHRAATVDRFQLSGLERAVVQKLCDGGPTLDELSASPVAPQALVRRLIYLLAVTRHLETGYSGLPAGVDDNVSSSARVARLALRKAAAQATEEHAPRTFDPRREEDHGPLPSSGERLGTSGSSAGQEGHEGHEGALLGASRPAEPADHDPQVEVEPESGLKSVPPTLPSGGMGNVGLDDLTELLLRAAESREGAKTIAACRKLFLKSSDNPVLAAMCLWLQTLGTSASAETVLEMLDETVEQNPGFVYTRLFRGMVRKREHDWQGAAADFRAVLARVPSHRRARLELDQVEARLGKTA
jgi:hypothetical protein